jgi:hypothetical protein
MARGRGGRPGGGVAAMLLLLLGAGGAGAMVAAVTTMPAPPPRPGAGADEFGSEGSRGVARGRSEPVRVRSDVIGLDAPLEPTGVGGSGVVEIPPLSQPTLAGWYRLGPSPGERGNAVLVGHVDTRKTGPAVFYELGRLERDDEIEIERADGSVAVFRVEGVRSYPKARFPSALVYGPTNRVGLRLVTCGGTYDKKRRTYRDNVVVYAALASWHR